ncbi:helix-turn-helix domain-containing protein [Limnofasciculus baicalensis]|uniref:Transcriptional regulator n=1 Tax=Limnofasciculus baicalensis BBK-W-15 TaxID=2699891 RepID=A0AAE3KM65_9CYAN|nr:transcriptional regulator [Limnofasciculus baicalensis]MCP2728879.1 transcriptional regulator [Limnofasciculus baicalensis BBK-W-15]
MTFTFNPETYAKLLTQYQPKAIETEEENERAIALAEELAHRQNRTAEESALFKLLIALIEKYEDEQYPMGNSTPHSMLLHLMEARGLEDADLIEIIGSSAVTAEIFQGRREISLAEAMILGEFFHVDPRLFI